MDGIVPAASSPSREGVVNARSPAVHGLPGRGAVCWSPRRSSKSASSSKHPTAWPTELSSGLWAYRRRAAAGPDDERSGDHAALTPAVRAARPGRRNVGVELLGDMRIPA